MSKRVDITGKIFGDIFVLEYSETKHTHAYYKCLCMNCNILTYASYSNLISGNTKGCQSCGNRKTSNAKIQDIAWELKNSNKNIAQISRDYSVNISTVYNIKNMNII